MKKYSENIGLIYTILFVFIYVIYLFGLKNVLSNITQSELLSLNFQILLYALMFSLAFTAFSRNCAVKSLINTRYILTALFIGFLSSFITDYLLNTGLKISTPTNLALINSSTVVFTYLFAVILIKAKVTVTKSIFVSLILGSLYFFITKGTGITIHNGDSFILAAAFIFGLINVLTSLVSTKIAPLQLTYLRILGGLVSLFVYLAVTNKFTGFSSNTGLLIIGGLYFATTYMINLAFKYYNPVKVSTIIALIPILTYFIEILLFKITLSYIEVFSGILAIICVTIFVRLKQ